MNPDEQRSRLQIDGIVADIAKSILPKVPTTAEQQCMLRAQQVSKQVGIEYMGQLKLRLTRPSKEQAFEEVASLYRDKFKDWSKDDLLYICSLSHASFAIDQISDELS